MQVFVEIGPHPTTAALIKASVRSKCAEPLVLPSLRRGERGLDTLRSSAAFLYARGLDLDWTRVTPPGRLVRLPRYPWQRERYWIDAADRGPASRVNGKVGPADVLDGRASQSNGQEIGKSSIPAGASPEDEQAKLVHDIPGSVGGPEVAELEDVDRGPSGRPAPPAGDNHQRLLEGLREQVAAVLGMEPEKVDPDRPLMSMGLDSLTAVDLKMGVESSLGVTFPLSSLLEGTTLRDLATAVGAAAAPENPPQSADVRDRPDAESQSLQTPQPVSPELDQPLSHGQQMLWYAHQFAPIRAAYHVTGAGLVHAKLDFDALRRAFRQVIARQDALRTMFAAVEERPTARLLGMSELALREEEWLPIEDVSEWDDAEIKDRLAELACRPFELSRGPLFRVHLLSRSAGDHVFLLVFHHIIADFWSAAVFLGDFMSAYAAELEGRGQALASPRWRYADFARWQNQMVAGEEGERHWAYWENQLAGPLPVLDLPTDFPRPVPQSFRARLATSTLSRS